MAINPLPPQAYTKETLQKAYAWLLTQSTSVKEMAQDQNILVSLYLKAQRNGEAALEAPSIQNFKQELKSLANMMGDFQQAPPASQATMYQSMPQMTMPPSQPVQTVAPMTPSVSTQPAQSATELQAHLHTQSIQTQTVHTITQTKTSDTDIKKLLDSKSLESLEQVKQSLNIGSDIEALRVLITFGIKHFNKLDL